MPASDNNLIRQSDKSNTVAHTPGEDRSKPSFLAGPWEPASEEFPGDWDAHPTEGGCAEWQCIRSKGQTIAIVVRDYERPDHVSEDEFNEIVNLVSAAPDTLEALKDLYDLCTLGASKTAFHNGVTDSTGSIDEGDVRAGEYLARARSAIQRAEGQGT